MVEDRQRECLSLRVGPQVCLEPKGINGWDEGFDGVERGTWDRSILCHVASAQKSKDQSSSMSPPICDPGHPHPTQYGAGISQGKTFSYRFV